MRTLRVPLPFGRWFRHHYLKRIIAKRFTVSRIDSGPVTFVALDSSVEEVNEIREIDPSQICRCLEQLRSWCGGSSLIAPIRVYCLGRKADACKLPWPMKLLGHGTKVGCWDTLSQTSFVCFDDSYPILQITVHELTHAWFDMASGHWPFPKIFEEGFARSIERMFGFQPIGYDFTGWEDPARNLEHVLTMSTPLLIRDLLNSRKLKKLQNENSNLVHLELWETDALLAFLRDYICHDQGLTSILDRMRNCGSGRRARLEWLAKSCNISVQNLEHEFEMYIRKGCWKPLIP